MRGAPRRIPFATTGSDHIIDATATLGGGFNSAPSSTRSQFAAGVGIVHRF
ncbi:MULTISPECIES: hypothetical protein [Burkholderia]|uniref:hypothetical protein n=1 Tax=Burkholderia TaxID=32008 RepID=UPI000A51A19C|nr:MULTISPECIES: hypothetical protein [Burkholderia]